MLTERRIERKRTPLHRHLEMSCLRTNRHYEGDTIDASDGGLRVCLDRTPDTGSDVFVRLFWEVDQKPIESFGRVAWQAPMPGGEGIHVGLMLGSETPDVTFDSIEHSQTVVALPTPETIREPEPILLHPGTVIPVRISGINGTAIVEEVNPSDESGHLLLKLQLQESSVIDGVLKTMQEEAIDVSSWNINPLQGALRWVLEQKEPLLTCWYRYGAPSCRVLFKTLIRCGTQMAQLGKSGYRRLPLSLRVRLADGRDRLESLTHIRRFFT